MSHKTVEPRRVAGRTACQHPAGEAQLEIAVLFHLPEPGIVLCRVRHRPYIDRLLTADVPGRVERVDADIHQAPATGKLLVEPPLFGVPYTEPRAVLDELELAGLFLPRRLDEPQRVRLVLHSIADLEQ